MSFFSNKKNIESQDDATIICSNKKETLSMLDKLLLVVDGSSASKAAISYTLALANETHSHITVIYVVDTETMDYLMNMKILAASERILFEQQLDISGKHILEQIQCLAKKQNISLKTILTRGVFHKEVLNLAAEEHSNLIVVGGWKRTITRKDKPSVERQMILDEAPCPVLIIKE